jgi:transcriptional regulator with XRE-family HTH domain
MNIDIWASDVAILRELGSRVAELRLQRNLTQQELSVNAGVSKRTIERFEKGEVGIQLTVLIRILRALGAVEGFDALVPKPLPSPIEMLKREGKTRKRASSTGNTAREPDPWTWGDEP